jgi:hypothetical protein
VRVPPVIGVISVLVSFVSLGKLNELAETVFWVPGEKNLRTSLIPGIYAPKILHDGGSTVVPPWFVIRLQPGVRSAGAISYPPF